MTWAPMIPTHIGSSSYGLAPQSVNQTKAKTTSERTRYETRQVRRQRRGNKEEATRRSPSQCGSRVRSRRVAGNLSPWRGERCRGARMVVDHGSLNPEELYNTLFWPSPSSSKSLIIQVPYHPCPSSTKPRPSSLHQSRFFFPCP